MVMAAGPGILARLTATEWDKMQLCNKCREPGSATDKGQAQSYPCEASKDGRATRVGVGFCMPGKGFMFSSVLLGCHRELCEAAGLLMSVAGTGALEGMYLTVKSVPFLPQVMPSEKPPVSTDFVLLFNIENQTPRVKLMLKLQSLDLRMKNWERPLNPVS